MGRHSRDVSRFYRGRHRAPTTTGRTAARVAVAGAVTLAPVGAVAAPASAAESASFDHDAIIACESGGDARAQNSSSSASGLYQFIDSTWKAYGGSTARAKDASPAEQRRVANRAFAAEGYTPWASSKSCWSSKLGSGSSTRITNAEEKPAPKRVAPKVTPKRVAPKQVAPKTTSAPQRSSSADRSASSHALTGIGVGTHTVQVGDTLSGIVLARTGSADWSKTYQENRDVIGTDPHTIIPGQKLDVVK